jgi:DNA-directed RNA polymerase specialized sigma24 family protein
MTDTAPNPRRAIDSTPTGDEEAIIPPAPESAEILISERDDPKYAGDPDEEAESEAGDNALPLNRDKVTPASPTSRDPARRLHYARLTDRKHVEGVTKFLSKRKRLQEADAEDVAQDALARALCAKKLPEPHWNFHAWLRRYANYQFLKFVSARKKRRDREALVGDMDVHAVEPARVDDRMDLAAQAANDVAAEKPAYQQISNVVKLQTKTDSTFQEAAIQSGLDPDLARKQYERFKKDARKRYLQYAAVALGVVVLVLYIAFGRDDDHRDHVTSPRPTARELRAQGLELCAKHYYKPCLERLDWAKDEDPQEPPEVVKAREEAKTALEHGSGGAGGSSP